MISPPSKEQFNSRPEDSWPLFSLEFFWHGSLTELRVSDFSPETHRFIQLSAAAVTTKPFPSICLQTGKQMRASDGPGVPVFKSQRFPKVVIFIRGPLKVFH